MKTLFLLGIVLVVAVRQDSGTEHYLSEVALDVNLPTRLAAEAPHAVEVSRTGSPELLRVAEATLPPRSAVAMAAEAFRRRAPDISGEVDLWSVGVVEGVRIPYAVNALAVTYYLELGERLRKGEPVPELPSRPPATSLRYTATVTRMPRYVRGTDVFNDVNVARLELDFSTGRGYGIMFSAERIVVLSLEGEVLTVYGDAAPEVWLYGGLPHDKGRQLTDRSCHGSCEGNARAKPAAPDAPAAEARSGWAAERGADTR